MPHDRVGQGVPRVPPLTPEGLATVAYTIAKAAEEHPLFHRIAMQLPPHLSYGLIIALGAGDIRSGSQAAAFCRDCARQLADAAAKLDGPVN